MASAEPQSWPLQELHAASAHLLPPERLVQGLLVVQQHPRRCAVLLSEASANGKAGGKGAEGGLMYAEVLAPCHCSVAAICKRPSECFSSLHQVQILVLHLQASWGKMPSCNSCVRPHYTSQKPPQSQV